MLQLTCQYLLKAVIVQRLDAQLLGKLGDQVGHIEAGGQALQRGGKCRAGWLEWQSRAGCFANCG